MTARPVAWTFLLMACAGDLSRAQPPQTGADYEAAAAAIRAAAALEARAAARSRAQPAQNATRDEESPTLTVTGLGPEVEIPLNMKLSVALPDLECASLNEMLGKRDAAWRVCEEAARGARVGSEIRLTLRSERFEQREGRADGGVAHAGWRWSGSVDAVSKDFEAMGRFCVDLQNRGYFVSSLVMDPDYDPPIGNDAWLAATAEARRLAVEKAGRVGLKVGQILRSSRPGSCRTEKIAGESP